MTLRALALAVFVVATVAAASPPADPAALQAEQNRLAERLWAVERRLSELSAAVEDPSHASTVSAALAFTRGSDLARDMAAGAELIAAGRYGAAAELQDAVLARLRHLESLLSPRPSAGIDELRAMADRVARLSAEQVAVLQRTRPVAAHPGERLPDDLVARQAAVAGETRDLSVTALGSPASHELAAAAASAADAAAALAAGDLPTALSAQAVVIEQLDAAARALAAELARAERELGLAARKGLREALRAALAGQSAVRTDTETLLSGAPSAPDRLSRADRVRALDLAERQDALLPHCDEAMALAQELTSTVFWPDAIRQLRQDVSSVADLLRAADLAAAASLQRDVEAVLDALIEALEPSVAAGDEEDPLTMRLAQTDPSRQRPLQDVRVAEELKVMRALQALLNERVARASRRPDEADPRQSAALADSQAAISTGFALLMRLEPEGIAP
jgi:hypothetical protein